MELAYDPDHDAFHGAPSSQNEDMGPWRKDTDYDFKITRYESRWQASGSGGYSTFEGQGTRNLPLVRNHSSLGTRPWPANLATGIQYPPYQGQGTEGTGDGFKQEGGAQDERYQPEERTSNKPLGHTGELKELETMVKKMVSKTDSLDRKLAQLEAWMEDESQGRVMQPRCESLHHPVKNMDDQDRNPYHQEGPDDEMTLDEDAKGKYVHGVDEQTSAAARHRDPCQDRVLAIAERGDHQDFNDSGFGEKQGEGTCVEEEVIANLRLEREEESLDAEFDLDALFDSLGFHKLLDGFNCSHNDDQQPASYEDLWWIEGDFEAELELELGKSCHEQNASSASIKDHIKKQEDLLAEWFKIEAELGTTDLVQPAVSRRRSHENIEMESEAALAEWHLVELSLEAEKKLEDITSVCVENDDDMKVKIDDIVRSARSQIENIMVAAQEDIQNLKKAGGTSCELSVTVNPEVLIKDVPVIEPEPSLNRQIWQDNDQDIGDSYQFSMNQFPSDIDSDMEDLQLYLDLSCDEEDRRKSSPQSINFSKSDVSNLPEVSRRSLYFTSVEETDVETTMLFHKLNPGLLDVSSEAMNSEASRSVNIDGKHCRPSWRWSGIWKIPILQMPHDTLSGKRQRGDSTWRRKWRNYNKTTELQVRRHRQKLKYGHNHKGNRSLHTIAYLTLCVLKNQMMGPAMRKQKKPLACWRYSRTNTHGILWNQDLRDLRCTEHHSAPHANFYH